MPVDFTPFLLLLAMVAAPVALFASKKWVIASLLLIGEIVLTVIYIYGCFHPPAALFRPAEAGNRRAAFELARWYTARKCFGQGIADFDTSWKWLKQSADAGYPPALYTSGVLYKKGNFLPLPPDSQHVSFGTPRPDLVKGQRLIDRAISEGFVPPSPEKVYYFTVFCIPNRPISYNGE